MDHLPLEQLAAISIAGDDRRAYLQGQLTQDLHQLSASRSLLTGWNNPQGRLLVVGQLIERSEDILLIVPKELIDGLIARLRMFVLRAAVTIEPASATIFGLSNLAQDTLGLLGTALGADPQASCALDASYLARLAGDPSRALLIGNHESLLATVAATDSIVASADVWKLMDIDCGIPHVDLATAESFVPQMVNLDLLDGISFSKGCYVGQEIVARTQNLGRIKRRMFLFKASGGADLEVGGPLFNSDETKVGQAVAVAQADNEQRLLAVVNLANISEPIYSTNKTPLEKLELPYAIPLSS